MGHDAASAGRKKWSSGDVLGEVCDALVESKGEGRDRRAQIWEEADDMAQAMEVGGGHERER